MITEQQAIEITKQLASQEGWTWIDPPLVTVRAGPPKQWEVRSNSQGHGMNVRAVIDADTGEVVSKGYNPR